ncbi:unnamed protein product, partial [Laminaria digitata]
GLHANRQGPGWTRGRRRTSYVVLLIADLLFVTPVLLPVQSTAGRDSRKEQEGGQERERARYSRFHNQLGEDEACFAICRDRGDGIYAFFCSGGPVLHIGCRLR